ncbi:MAG: bifunctional phosphopantothenoylcysteine decarboxylase/phosphopantothenate--cysteine ligase CoaBC [Pseudomonadota bacterium]
MNFRKNKRVLVGVTGGIAAYKSPELVRRLRDRGCEVRVVLTEGGKNFITALTLQAVSGYPVHEHLLDSDAESGMGHIELARWADDIVVAPATANFLAKIAHGTADDLLSTLILATTARVAVAPAMNQQMWSHPATQKNLQAVRDLGVEIIGPGQGDQACGEVGPGRMTEPDDIAQRIAGDGIPQRLSGRKVLLTAGPTWEALDPVRGITNHSSGKMGYALAQAAADMGAIVTIVSGPVSLSAPEGVDVVPVQSAQNMLDAVMKRVTETDVFIAVAAVADYRPADVSEQKIKKSDSADTMSITMVKNPDILASVGEQSERPVTVGFAAETENLLQNARKKLKSKNVDMIVANSVSGEESAFGSDRNRVTLVTPSGDEPLQDGDKYEVSMQILSRIADLVSS